jgi:hypothetical protein
VRVSPRPDPKRLGGLEWTRRTGGALTRAERRRLLGTIARGQAQNVVGRVKLATGRLPAGAADVDVTTFDPPDSALAREAEEACAEQPAAVIGHSYRTWLFGLALAAVDRAAVDRELFYAAALIHDHGISAPTPGRDFTIASAERAIACAEAAGAGRDVGETVGDAICVHPTPGITPERDGTLGCYVQWGAMVDVAGLRAWDVSRANREAVVAAHPRRDFKRAIAALVRAESGAVPKGRFALLSRCGFALAIRMAPYDE